MALFLERPINGERNERRSKNVYNARAGVWMSWFYNALARSSFLRRHIVGSFV